MKTFNTLLVVETMDVLLLSTSISVMRWNKGELLTTSSNESALSLPERANIASGKL